MHGSGRAQCSMHVASYLQPLSAKRDMVDNNVEINASKPTLLLLLLCCLYNCYYYYYYYCCSYCIVRGLDRDMTSSALWSAPSTSLISNKDWQFIPEISTLTDIHLTFTVISGGLLVYLRHEPYIRHRSLTLSLMMLVICALLIFYSISRQTLPMDGSGCYINYLVLGTLMPTW
ncbi:hypothetical protein BDF19DRAFT_456217 [Syncephalis fuscata]|nr:hypothetical protein BDF19DRAFT_456217 [Syncephalis fuscata]